MITWQEVVDKEQISGTPIGYSAANIDSDGQYAAETSDWFNGMIAWSNSGQEGFPPDDLGDYDSFTIIGDRTLYYFDWGDWSQSYNNGLSTAYYYTSTRFDEVFEESDAGSGTTSSSTYDSNWSRISVNLPSHELTTLQNQSGRITITSESQEAFLTTSAFIGTSPATTISVTAYSYRPVTITTTASISTSTIATWQVKTYDTVYFTGQTTANFYSSFSNELPATFGNSITTVQSTIQPLSFVEISGYENTQNFTVKTVVGSVSQNAVPTTTNVGVTTFNSTNPITETNFQSIPTTSFQFLNFQKTQNQPIGGIFTTSSTNIGIVTTTSANFLSSTIALQYLSTSSIETTSEGFDSIESGTSSTYTQSGSFALNPIYNFLTTVDGSILGATQATVGVRVNTTDGVGGGISPEGAGNFFYQHTASVALPATRSIRNSIGEQSIFSLDSYTKRDSNGGETSGKYFTTGSSTSIFQIIFTTVNIASNNPVNTVVGGPIRGEALIYNGKYSTFADNLDGTTSVTKPFQVVWESSAETTAWIPAFEAKTVGAANNVLAISRHSITTVIDD